MPGNYNPSLQQPKRELADDQVERLFRVAEVGIQWVAGNISVEQVQERLGKPETVMHNNGGEYFSYGIGDFGVGFKWYPERDNQKDGDSRIFDLGVDDWITTSISRDLLADRLGLNRVKPGELIDGVRRETLGYMGIPILPNAPFPNRATLNYRLPLPNDSPFDVYAEFEYDRIPDKPGKSTFEKTDDFRSMRITRTYLTPKELQERNEAKRLKYGYMNLCTGMVCPETGLLEGWTKEKGATDILQVQKGQTFDVVRTVPAYEDRGSCPMVEGQWMWLCSLEEVHDFTWFGITLRG